MVQERVSIQRENAALQVTSCVKSQFQGISKWALILSTIGFVVISMVLVAAILSTVNMGIMRSAPGISPFFVGFGYLIVSSLLLIPVVALFQFGTRLKVALKEEDQAAMDQAFVSLNSVLRCGGLAVIGTLVFGLLGVFF
ncbi:MAG: hypothetical protein ACI8YQ_004177 [Polaribacter sp.]|jgi:hypothetical protein